MTWLVPLLAAAVSGSVYLRQADLRRPVAGAQVIVRTPAGGQTLRTVTTDALGRYRLDDLPRKRVLLRVDVRGHFTRAVASRESTLLLDLSGGDLSGADFEAQRGGVITGRLTDPWGDPLDKIVVLLTRLSGAGDHTVRVTTDDRGLYRAWGLSPGRYQVSILPPGRRPIVHASGPFDVKTGQEIGNIDVVLRQEPLYEVQGRVAGLPPEDLTRARVKIRPLREDDSPVSAEVRVNADGNFVLPRLPAGAYWVSLLGRNDTLARQRLDVTADHAGLVLRPSPLGALSGRVIPVGRAKPPLIWLQAMDSTGQEAFVIAARPPEYRFDLANRWPDAYSLHAHQPKGAYVLEPGELVVGAGGTTEAVIRVGLDPGRLSGTVKAPGGGPLPHGRVALARFEGGKILVRSEQADQNGRFEISGLEPGNYRICACAPDAPETWERVFVIAPDSQIEVELTAAP
jgi:hypothetical protein